jgi:hypothetical protein
MEIIDKRRTFSKKAFGCALALLLVISALNRKLGGQNTYLVERTGNKKKIFTIPLFILTRIQKGFKVILT